MFVAARMVRFLRQVGAPHVGIPRQDVDVELREHDLDAGPRRELGRASRRSRASGGSATPQCACSPIAIDAKAAWPQFVHEADRRLHAWPASTGCSRCSRAPRPDPPRARTRTPSRCNPAPIDLEPRRLAQRAVFLQRFVDDVPPVDAAAIAACDRLDVLAHAGQQRCPVRRRRRPRQIPTAGVCWCHTSVWPIRSSRCCLPNATNRSAGPKSKRSGRRVDRFPLQEILGRDRIEVLRGDRQRTRIAVAVTCGSRAPRQAAALSATLT